MDDEDFKAQPLPGGRRRRQQGPAAAARAVGQEGAGEAGGLRCQLCGQDLALLSAAGRRQHANRCLDDIEKLRLPSASSAFECPICGKGFRAPESRSSHLKRCAAKMAVPPQLLLQVVRQQTPAQGSCSDGVPAGPSGLKRKGPSSAEPSTKKHKTEARREKADEELLVALAMSRSLHEEEAKAGRLASGRQAGPWQGKKKNRAMASHVPPSLLLQDLEKARQQTEERVALLLSEAVELPCTRALPTGRLLESELSRRADWPLALPKGPPGSLWERSSLAGLSAPGSFGVSALTLPASPWQTDQRPTQSTVLPLYGQTGPEAKEKLEDSGLLQERACGNLQDMSFAEERKELDCSPQDAGTLQALIELAGEGLTLTQWGGASPHAEELGQGRVPGNFLRGCREEETPAESCSQPFLLGSLAAAFKGMVNNPHLSDIQFQTDRGEVFYAHLFVLYARCPQLMEVVDQTGFVVAEEGARTRRVLLNDVSGEAAGVFLNYLYTAEDFIPQHVLSEVAALAVRFGLPELAALCASHGGCGRPVPGVPEREEEERSEKFEELLKSIWVGEEDEGRAPPREEAGREAVVGERELEEIYEFAATQRKAEEGRPGGERRQAGGGPSVEPEAAAAPMDPADIVDPTEGKGSLDPECSQLQGHDARKEAGTNLSLEAHGPLGAATGRSPEAPLELAEASEETGEQSLLSVCWGESSAFPQPSYVDDAAGAEGAAVKSPTPPGLGKGFPPVSRNFPSGDFRALPENRTPTSPGQRGSFGGELSPALFSPTQEEAAGRPRPAEERVLAETSFGAAAPGGPDNASFVLAPLPPFSLVTLDSDKEAMPEEREERRWPAEKRAASGQESGSREWKRGPGADLSSCQKLSLQDGNQEGTGEPWQGNLPCSAGGARIPPWLNCSGPELGLNLGAKPQPTGDIRDGRPAPKSPPTPSPERPSLRGFLPPCHRSPTPCPPREAKTDVIVVDDSEEEREAAPDLSWGSLVLEEDLPLAAGGGGHRLATPEGPVAARASGCREYVDGQGRPPGTLPPGTLSGTPPGGSRVAGDVPPPLSGRAEGERCSGENRSRRRDSWDSDGDETEDLPLTQRVFAAMAVHSTPASPTDLACQEQEVPCPTPTTPMPSYSIMESPELKKELNRFGVRRLPKRQMVLKLKEIFQYTHRRAEDEASASQPVQCRGTQAEQQERATVSSAEVGASQEAQKSTAFSVAAGDNTLVLLRCRHLRVEHSREETRL